MPLTLCAEYPLKPPSIMFLTPSGRFATNTRVCLSISDFHPETWTPSWTVGTILSGIVSFFNSEEMTVGAVSASPSDRQRFAASSMSTNARDKTFVELFGTDMTVHWPEEVAKESGDDGAAESDVATEPPQTQSGEDSEKISSSSEREPGT